MALPAARLATESGDHAFFGHPRGLSTLFFTEMWERFSYYGMRAFLILFMTAAPATGGMGFDAATAAAIYGIYTVDGVHDERCPAAGSPTACIGQRNGRAVRRHPDRVRPLQLAVPSLTTFYLGLVLIVLGTGLLKPTSASSSASCTAHDDIRRDAGFSIFYMGINLGAFLGPLVSGFLAQDVRFRAMIQGWGSIPMRWHLGFGAAGVGMMLGLVQYIARPASTWATPGSPRRRRRRRQRWRAEVQAARR